MPWVIATVEVITPISIFSGNKYSLYTSSSSSLQFSLLDTGLHNYHRDDRAKFEINFPR